MSGLGSRPAVGPVHQPFASVGRVPLLTKSPTADATIDFDTLITTRFQSYIFDINALTSDTDDNAVAIRLGTGSGPTYQATAYDYGTLLIDATGASPSSAGQAATEIIITRNQAGGDLGTAAGEALSGTVQMFAPTNSTAGTLLKYDLAYRRSSDGGLYMATGGGLWDTTTSITALRFFMTTAGDFNGGSITMYGVR